MKLFFKKLKIEKKILIIFSILLIITQVFTAIIAYFNIFRINNFFNKEMKTLSSDVLKTGETLIQSQIEEYLDNISYSTAKSSDSVFNEISNNISTISNTLKDIYNNKNNFIGYIPPLPEFYKSEKESDKNIASHKAYAIDSSSKTDNLLVYNIAEYSNYSKKIFKTDITYWNSLTDSERINIIDKYSVVSNNNIPLNLYRELLTLSNAKYILEPIFENNSYISSIYIGTESGLLYKYSSDSSSSRYDPRSREWYISAKSSVQNNISDPAWQKTYISNSTGKLCITCSKAFTDNSNDVIGVCAIDMNLDDISKLITPSDFGENGYSFIIDNESNIIIKSDKYVELLNTNNLDISPETMEEIKLNKHGIINLEINEQKYYMGYAPLSTPNWTICSIIQEKEATKPITEIHQIIKDSTNKSEDSINKNYLSILIQFFIEFFICLILTYFITLKLSKTISKPIVELSEKAKIIGEGNFSIDIPITAEDEVGNLAKSFNTMVENLQLYMQNLTKTVAEKEKIHSELLIAKKIQKSMMPYIFPAYPDRDDLDIYALVDPAREVGGDFYDFFFIDDKHLALVIADVSDKGISAALFMVIAKILIKNQLQNGDSPSKIFQIINNKLCENNDAGMFVTCFLGILNVETGKFIYANAGHNPPILYKKLEKTCLAINDPHSFVLGGMPNLKYTENEFYLSSGDILLLYTDGVTEAIDDKGELFSQSRLEKIVFNSVNRDYKVDDLVHTIRKEIEVFSKGADRTDDITMLAFKNISINSQQEENLKE